jgi:hypothetical protein
MVEHAGELAGADHACLVDDHELVAEGDVPDFLDAAMATLSNLDMEQRKILNVLIDMLLVACESNLETSIAMASSALELASEEWLPKGAVKQDVEKPARKAIRKALVDAAQKHAPGTQFAENAANIAGYIFNSPAKARFRALLTQLDIEHDDGVDEFVNTRNRVVHGGFQNRPLNERIRALLFGRWMLATCIVRYLGYSGPLIDWRDLEVR